MGEGRGMACCVGRLTATRAAAWRAEAVFLPPTLDLIERYGDAGGGYSLTCGL